MTLRVLIVVPDQPHGHSYLHDLVALGLKEVVEAEWGEVEIWPGPATWLHLPEDPARPLSWAPAPGSRDACWLDCDAALPQGTLTGPPDLIIGGVHALKELHRATSAHGKCPVAVIDGFDDATDFRQQARDAAQGRMCAYFKRELPLGQSWAIPLPFTYPDRWVPDAWHMGRVGVVYYTSVHEGRAAARLTIAAGLRQLGDEADVVTTDDRARRPSPEALHARLWYGLVGVHWNTFAPNSGHGWDGHRFCENAAYGVVNVAQRPFIEYPNPFTHGENVIWCDTPEEVPRAVEALLEDRDRALCIALAGHLHFLKYHSATARARYVLEHAGFSNVEG